MGARWMATLGASAGLVSAATLAQSLPSVPGTCTRTYVAAVSQRLVDGSTGQPIPGSGSAVNFANGAYQVSYEEVQAVNLARSGDPVVLCLVRVPENCPPGDNRGKLYATVDLRTLLLWVLPDSEHTCGGA